MGIERVVAPEVGDLTEGQRKAGAEMARAAAIMALLRSPEGCPWDREQTFDSIKRYTLEETYEVFDAIERRDWPELKAELGDLLLQVLFYAQMAEEAGLFTLAEVAETLNAKLVRRHPHVFGAEQAADAAAVIGTWDRVKAEERVGTEQAGLLDRIPRTMPAIMEAAKLGKAAGKAGFDWPDASGLFEKLDEEMAELRAEWEPAGGAAMRAEAVEGELGDLLFTAVNLARHLGVDPEEGLRRTNAKFRARFGTMEQVAGGSEAFVEAELARKEELWVAAKRKESQEGQGG